MARSNDQSEFDAYSSGDEARLGNAQPHAADSVETSALDASNDSALGAGETSVDYPPATTRDESTPSYKYEAKNVKGSIAGGMWVSLIFGILLLILLLVFIVQNPQPTQLNLFAWHFQFPTAVGLLFAAIVGALIMALVGGIRIIQLRRQVRQL